MKTAREIAHEDDSICFMLTWQCSKCRGVFFGRHRMKCAGCGAEGCWTGSVDPRSLAEALPSRPHTPTCDRLTAAIEARDAHRAASPTEARLREALREAHRLLTNVSAKWRPGSHERIYVESLLPMWDALASAPSIPPGADEPCSPGCPLPSCQPSAAPPRPDNVRSARVVAHALCSQLFGTIPGRCTDEDEPDDIHGMGCDVITNAIEADRALFRGAAPPRQALDPATVEACARACEKSYRTAVDGLNDFTGEAAATLARAHAARCIRALATTSKPAGERLPATAAEAMHASDNEGHTARCGKYRPIWAMSANLVTCRDCLAALPVPPKETT